MRKNNSIRLKIWLAAAIVMISSTFIISLSTVLLSQSNMREDLLNGVHNQHQAISSEIKDLINYTNYLHSEFILDTDFRQMVESNDDKSIKENEFKNIAKRITPEAMIKDIAIIYSSSNDSISLNSMFDVTEKENSDFFNEVIRHNELVEIGKIKKDSTSNYLMVGKRINLPYDKETKAIAVYYIDESEIRACFKNALTYNDSTVFISNEGYIISNSNEKYIGTTLFASDDIFLSKVASHETMTFDNSRSLVVVTPMTSLNSQFKTSLNVVSIIPEREVYKGVRNVSYLMISISLIFLLVSTPIIFGISRRITDPLIEFSSFLKENNKEDEYKMIDDPKKYDELEELGNAYNSMVSHINYLIEKNKEDSEHKRKLELEAMQMQVNPHFLYNVLDTISWIAKIKKQDDIQRITMSLASFFRLSLHKGDKYVTVEDEISLIRSYSDIEFIRRHGNFKIEYDINEKVLGIKILKLVMQPLLENAFKHGIATKKDGLIKVSAYMESDYLVLSIEDNGEGFDSTVKKETETTLSGFGLKNIRERLFLEYKDNASLTLDSTPGEGTKAIIRIYQSELIV